MSRVYLDHNATTMLRPEARQAMLAAMDVAGNPSSVHAEGRAARAVIEDARETIAEIMRVAPKDIIFTSGGTEAAQAAIAMAVGFVASAAGMPLNAVPVLVSAGEHPCVLRAPHCNSPHAQTLPLSDDGVVDAAALRARVAEVGPCVIALQDANNETGVRQPDLPIADIQASGAVRISDMVQTAGRFSSELRAHVGFISAHKFGGPKGVGAVAWLGRDLGEAPVAALIHGGGQERGRRGGTENVIGIAGMAAAMKAADADRASFAAWSSEAQRRLETGIRDIAPDAIIFGESVDRLSNTTCFAVPGVTAELALMAFDLDGIAVSSGSACSSGKVAPSHVLRAMGVPDDLARGAIRVSTGWTSRDEDIARFLGALAKLCRHRAVSRAA